MKVAADTNVLVRAVIEDDAAQSAAAVATLHEAHTVAITVPALCELVWVLSKRYGADRREIAAAIRALLNAKNVKADRDAVDAGLALLDAGGDFADGVIAYEGARLGGEQFLSFDRRAVKLLSARGVPARLIG